MFRRVATKCTATALRSLSVREGLYLPQFLVPNILTLTSSRVLSRKSGTGDVLLQQTRRVLVVDWRLLLETFDLVRIDAVRRPNLFVLRERSASGKDCEFLANR